MTNKMANITRKGRILAWGDLPFMTAALRLEVVSEALHRLFQAHETTYTEPLNNLCGGTAPPVHRHCGTCSSALRHLFIDNGAPVHRRCDTCASAMRHPCIGNVTPVHRRCSPCKQVLFNPYTGIYLSFVTHLLPHENSFVQRRFQRW